MAKKKHVDILRQGVEIWNTWREENPKVVPDLSKLVITKLDLSGANFEKVNFSDSKLTKCIFYETLFFQANLKNVKFKGSVLSSAKLTGADLSYADCSGVELSDAVIMDANLSHAKLSDIAIRGVLMMGSDFTGADLSYSTLQESDLSRTKLVNANLRNCFLYRTEYENADLTNADFRGSDLTNASFVNTKVEGANFDNCIVYGVSIWNLVGTPKSQNDLIISPPEEGIVTTDDLEVAQFVYLMYNNAKIRTVLNAATGKGVLILGRFTPPERKIVLDGLREKLREFDLLPIVFDFDRPEDKDYTETVQTLAGLSRFVIADVTNPKSTPLELEATVKQFKIPYVPIIDTSADERPFAMIVDLQKNFHWVLPTFGYRSKEELFKNLKMAVIDRAIAKHNELQLQKAKEVTMITINDLRSIRRKKLLKKKRK